MRTTIRSATSPDRHWPSWMLLAIAANVAPLGVATLLSSPLEPQVVALLEGMHDVVMQRMPDDFLKGLPGASAYYVTIHTAYFVAPALLLLMLLRFTRLGLRLALNRLTLALLVLGATGLVLRLGGGLYYHVANDAPHLSNVLGGVLDGLVIGSLVAGTSALVLSTVWYRWVQTRADWVRVLRRLWAQL